MATGIIEQIKEAEKKYHNLDYTLKHNKNTYVERIILERQREQLRHDIMRARRWLKACNVS